MELTKYDYQLLTIVSMLTVAVLILLGIITWAGTSVGSLWFMPLGWFVGAMMVWGYTKKVKLGR